jgi:hypothetical protein
MTEIAARNGPGRLGDKPRNVLLPADIATALAAMRAGAASEARVFAITERRINYIVKATAQRAGINPAASAAKRRCKKQGASPLTCSDRTPRRSKRDNQVVPPKGSSVQASRLCLA